MEQISGLTKKVKEFCERIGVDIVGFAAPHLYKRFPEYNRPEFYLKESKTVIIIGLYLYDIILDAWSQDQKSGRNYQFADAILENLGQMIKQFLSDQGYNSEIIPYTPGLFIKDSAALAGIGPIGKNNLLLTEQFGSQVRLRALTTTAPWCAAHLY